MSDTKREVSYEEERVDSPTSGTLDKDARIEDTIYNADLKAAIDNTQLDPWSRRAISLYFICMVGFLNAVSSGMSSLLCHTSCPPLLTMTITSAGFDGSLMGGINAMEQYLDYFHYKEVGASTGISEYLSPHSPRPPGPAIPPSALLAR